MLKRLRHIIFGDLKLKALALAIALAIWFYAGGRLKAETSISVRLTVEVPKGYQLVYQSEDKVRLRITGPQALISRLRDVAALNDVRMTARLEAGRMQRGPNRLEVKPEWLNVKSSELLQLHVDSMRPRHVIVYASEVVTRSFPVEVRKSGEPRRGYAIRNMTADPAEVTVRGPVLALDKMKSVKTLEIPVWDLQRDVVRMAPLVLEEILELEHAGKVVVQLQPTPAQVVVNIAVGGAEQDTLEGIPVRLLRPADFPYEVEIKPEDATVSVIVSGLSQELKKLTKESVTAYVDLTGLSTAKIAPGTSAPYKENVRLLLPEDIPQLSGRAVPEKITITLKSPAE